MSEVIKKKVLIFDLDDTLAESKQPLDTEMSDLLEELIMKGYLIAVTSGGSLKQFEKQFIGSLGFLPAHYESLFLMPTSGASFYRYQLGKWMNIYSHELDNDERNKIKDLLEKAVKSSGLWIDNSHGELIEDRGTQISYSGLGQQADIKEKSLWDPDQGKRKKIVEILRPDLPDYDIKMGGKTTIDITKKGVNKALAIKELSKYLNIPIANMTFIGDALYPGGNDAAAIESGIECVPISGVQDTKKYIKNLLGKS